MEIDVEKFIDQVTDEQFKATNFTIKKAALEADLSKAFAPMVSFIAEQIQSDQIAQARLIVEDADTVFKLETNVINLPFDYVKAISKIMSGEGVQPVNVYMIVESPEVNRSKLRIDETATADDFVASQAQMVTKVVDWAQTQLHKIDSEDEASEEEADETK
ncbi:hypothetical protein [Lactobacillus sp. Sy-1]|uniref:hypothetical protein n=1 Tax=Lactobacillus sp. Sy-1 TaxID=2109645 RepID=UPI001C5718F0|nr:hypothetical protein [Lactobacillus sp. Sy-1]MBW1604900.1 hypothetical protein [Lactobacillus sp. Sy-1]